MSIFYLLVFMLVGMSRMDAAPTRWESVTNNPYQQSEVERVLRDAIFNTTDNFYVIKKAFQAQPGSHKICIPIVYNITCADQPECEDSLTDNLGQCSSGYYVPVLWVEFNASDTASKLLLFFATSGFTVFGFDWADACDIPYKSFNLSTVSLPTLNLVISCNDTTLESKLNQTLLYLTTLMPNYAALSNFPSIFDDKIMGYAVEAELYFDDHQPVFIAYTMIFAIVSLFIILGLSTPLFVTIVESIETTDKGKPKLYYHFWSSVALITVGIWGYEVIYHVVHDGSQPYVNLLILMTVESIIGVIVAMSSTARGGDNLFSVPLSDFCCCGNKCRMVWSWVMTPIGLFIFLSLIVYILYAVPTIVLVYYLYPTRTLIRVPFIIGAVFYTITLLSLVLHQFEKIGIVAIRCSTYCHQGRFKNYIDIDYESDRNESNRTNDLEFPGLNSYRELQIVDRPRYRPYRYFWFNVKKVAWSHDRSYNYYNKKLREDLEIIQSWCYPIIGIFQLVAVMAILVAFVYGEVLLAQLVFKRTSDTDINSLLALLPTVIFSIFAWFGRNLIFDVREDLKELSIPYFKRKKTIEEKILQGITDLNTLEKRILQKLVKQESEHTADVDVENISCDH